MSGIGPQTNMSPGDAVRSILRSGPKLAIAAAVCFLLFLILPALSVSTPFGGIGVSGAAVGGFMGWLCLLAFVGAAAARFVPSIAPYRELIDLAAFGLLVLMLVWSVFFGPIAQGMSAANQLGALGNLPGAANAPPARSFFSIWPSFGVIFLVLAPVALYRARKAVTPALI